MTKYEFVETSIEGGVYTLTLNRPEKLNAIHKELDRDWLHALQEAEADPDVRVVLQRANGRAFSAGHDLVEVGNLIRELGDAAKDWNNIYARIWPEGSSPPQIISKFPKPVISAVQGYVTGQATAMVFNSDLIVAAEGTIFNMEVLRTGGGGGTSGMVGMLPAKLVAELTLLGTLPAERLYNAGVVNKVVPIDQLREAGESMAKAVARVHPATSHLFKQNLLATYEHLGYGHSNHEIASQSHGNDDDNGFWAMAAEKGVKEALRWRDSEFGEGQFATSKGQKQ
jgi:enoyl-CoA hydratase